MAGVSRHRRVPGTIDEIAHDPSSPRRRGPASPPRIDTGSRPFAPRSRRAIRDTAQRRWWGPPTLPFFPPDGVGCRYRRRCLRSFVSRETRRRCARTPVVARRPPSRQGHRRRGRRGPGRSTPSVRGLPVCRAPARPSVPGRHPNQLAPFGRARPSSPRTRAPRRRLSTVLG